MNVRPLIVETSGEALCDLIVDHPDGVVVVDGDGIVVFANPAAEHLLVPPGSTVIGMAFDAVATASAGDPDEITAPATAAVAGIRTSGIEWDGRHARLIALREAGVPTATSPSVPEPGMIFSPEAEELTGMGSFEIDLVTRRMKRSAGYRRITGRTEEFFVAHPFMTSEVISPDDRDRLQRELAEVAVGGPAHGTELRFVRPDGEIRFVQLVAQPIAGPDGAPVKVRGALRDVTDERRAVDALRASEARFRLLAEHSQDVIFLVGLRPGPTVEYVSPAVEDMVGVPAGDLAGDFEKVLATLRTENATIVRDAVLSAHPEPMMFAQPRPDGSVKWFELRLFGIRDDAGELVATEGALRDVTERMATEQKQRRLDQELQQAERLEALGRLAGGVAHDFNNLLAVVMGTAALLVDDTDAADPRLADMKRILYAAERGAALTRQLLIFSRREPSQPEALDLNEAIGGLEDLLRRTIGEDIEFVNDIARDLPAVIIDRGKLEQVVLNLVVNARAAMPDGGRLTIGTRETVIVGPHDREPVVPAGHYARLSVTDTGCGMEQEVAERAFEPFFTTRGQGEGTGLGLATVRGVVDEAGGHLTLDTAPGRGTTIEVYLPVLPIRPDAGPTTTVEPDGTLDGGGKTILVVEDEEAVREVITRILSRYGYRVLTAHNAARALAISAEPGRRIDLVLTDLIMPGISGDRFAELLWGTVRPGLPVLFMSGYAADRQGHGRAGPDDDAPVLYKPFDPGTVLRAVHDALDTSATG